MCCTIIQQLCLPCLLTVQVDWRVMAVRNNPAGDLRMLLRIPTSYKPKPTKPDVTLDIIATLVRAGFIVCLLRMWLNTQQNLSLPTLPSHLISSHLTKTPCTPPPPCCSCRMDC